MADFLSMLTSGKFTQPTTVEDFQAFNKELLANADLIKQYGGNVAALNVAGNFANELASYVGKDLNTVIDERGGQSYTIANKLADAYSSMKLNRLSSGFSSSYADIQKELANVQSNIANVTDFSNPNLTEAEKAAGLARAEQIKAENANLFAQAEKLGIAVADPVRTDTGYIPATEAAGTTSSALNPSTGTAPTTTNVGRTGEVLSVRKNEDGTFDIVGSSGKVYNDTPFTDISSALSKQTELNSGATPDAVGAFAEATGTSTSEGDTLLDVVNNTNGSLNANADFINGAFQAYLGRDATQAELDQYTGMTVDAVRNALKASSGSTVTGDVEVEVPDTFGSDFLDTALSDPTTDGDISSLMSQLETKQQELLDLMRPTDTETELKTDLADIRAEAEKVLTELSMGLNDINDQPIAMTFITGQSASVEARANTKLQNLARLESNLLTRLGLEQDARAVEASIAETQLGYLQTNIQTALQVKQLMLQEEDSIFNRAMALKADARDTLATILDSMAGLDEGDFSTDQLDKLNSLATSAGIPYSLLLSGMANVKNQMIADAANTNSLLDTVITLDDGTQVLVNAYGQEISSYSSSASSAGTVAWDSWLGSLSSSGDAVITQDFNTPVNYIPGRTIHGGYDIAIPENTNLISPVAGTVTFAGESSGWGNTVVIQDSSGNSWRLAHLNSIGVQEGNTVSAGQLIGLSGNTGQSTGPHLHIEMKDSSGNLVDVANVMTGANTATTLSKRQTEDLNTLTDDFRSDTTVRNFLDIRNAYNRIIESTSDVSAAGDLSLIFNYMKMLDPTSVVREGEFATASNAGGVPDRILAQYNKVISGERLSESIRNDFVAVSGRLYNSASQDYQAVVSTYTNRARSMNIDPSLFITSLPSDVSSTVIDSYLDSALSSTSTDTTSGTSYTSYLQSLFGDAFSSLYR